MFLTEKPPNLDQLTEAGDYCFISDKLVMACPVCGGIFYCPHEIVQRKPLTLSPSVVGPPATYQGLPQAKSTEQVLAPCGHHFWVKNGEVIDAA